MHCWSKCKMVQPLWKTVWWLLNKLNLELLHDSAISLLGVHVCVCIYTKENLHANVHSRSIHNSQKVEIMSTMDEWINKMREIHTMGYYLAIKRNEVSILATTWINLEKIMQSEGDQTPKTTYSMISFV